MSDPGFARPDLCSIRSADGQEGLAGAVREGFSADGYPPAGDDPPAPLTSGVDRAIRLSTAAAVLAVAGIAAYVSYWYAYAVVRAHGETGITAVAPAAPAQGSTAGLGGAPSAAAGRRRGGLMPVSDLHRQVAAIALAARRESTDSPSAAPPVSVPTTTTAAGSSAAPVPCSSACWLRPASCALSSPGETMPRTPGSSRTRPR